MNLENGMHEGVCLKCEGTGFVIRPHRQHEGLEVAEPCECRARDYVAGLDARAKIPTNYARASFENFICKAHGEAYERELLTVWHRVRMYVREYPHAADRPPGLMLIGDTGAGKTHLAVAALRALMGRGFAGLFWDYQNLLDSIRAGYDAAANFADKHAYQAALDAEVLLLDDLGAHRVTDWVKDTVTGIFTYRCNYRRPVIVTTNLIDTDADSACTTHYKTAEGTRRLLPTLAEHIGDRARSRLFEMCHIVQMPRMKDYRIERQRRSSAGNGGEQAPQ